MTSQSTLISFIKILSVLSENFHLFKSYVLLFIHFFSLLFSLFSVISNSLSFDVYVFLCVLAEMFLYLH